MKSLRRAAPRLSQKIPRILIAMLAAFALLGADAPRTRLIELRWTHAGDVAGFKIYTRHWGQEVGPARDVAPPQQRDGVFHFQLEVSNYDATYVSVSAYDSEGRESERSNELLFLLPDPLTEAH